MMPAERRPETTDSAGPSGPRRRPRVVIFQLADRARVEVVELSEAATVGSLICHGGRSWRVTGARTGDRVLIVELEAN